MDCRIAPPGNSRASLFQVRKCLPHGGFGLLREAETTYYQKSVIILPSMIVDIFRDTVRAH